MSFLVEESEENMKNWKYKLDFEGKALRELINKEETMENIIAIYKQLITCLDVLKKRLLESDKEDLEYEIEGMIEDLYIAMPDLSLDDLNYKEEQNTLNVYLKDFYDMCDNARVWIGV